MLAIAEGDCELTSANLTARCALDWYPIIPTRVPWEEIWNLWTSVRKKLLDLSKFVEPTDPERLFNQHPWHVDMVEVESVWNET